MRTQAVKMLTIGLLLGFLGTLQAGAYEEMAAVTNGGVIVGTVKFDGPVPKPKEIKIKKEKLDPKDIETCGLHKEPKLSEALIVSSGNKGIKNVVVSLVDIKKGKKIGEGFKKIGKGFWLPESIDEKKRENPNEKERKKPASATGKRAWINQNGCEFDPHIMVIPAGSRIEILNNDGIVHNVHAIGLNNPGFNRQQPGSKQRLITKKKDFEFAGKMPLKCDIHSWMSAWIIVAEHPYYALSSAKGEFKITDVPPGTYKLQFWQETLGEQIKEVTVKAGAETKMDIEFKPRAE